MTGDKGVAEGKPNVFKAVRIAEIRRPRSRVEGRMLAAAPWVDAPAASGAVLP